MIFRRMKSLVGTSDKGDQQQKSCATRSSCVNTLMVSAAKQAAQNRVFAEVGHSSGSCSIMSRTYANRRGKGRTISCTLLPQDPLKAWALFSCFARYLPAEIPQLAERRHPVSAPVKSPFISPGHTATCRIGTAL